MKVSAIIPAAGSGKRFGEEKQFKPLGGRPLLYQTLIPFIESNLIHEVIIVVNEKHISKVKRDVLSLTTGKKIDVVVGGEHRQDSVLNGIHATGPETTLVCIHDAARPFVQDSEIEKAIRACDGFHGSVVAIPAHDTIKYSENGLIEKTIDRDKIWLAQTPQIFQKEKLIIAFSKAKESNMIGTDESALMESAGFSMKLVEGHPSNFKITTKDDWTLAEFFINQREHHHD